VNGVEQSAVKQQQQQQQQQQQHFITHLEITVN